VCYAPALRAGVQIAVILVYDTLLSGQEYSIDLNHCLVYYVLLSGQEYKSLLF